MKRETCNRGKTMSAAVSQKLAGIWFPHVPPVYPRSHAHRRVWRGYDERGVTTLNKC